MKPFARLGAPLAALVLCAAPAAAAPAWTLGVSGGTTRFDAHLADYQWDVAAHPAFGAQAGVTLGRAGLALRAWSATSTQAIDAGASVASARVRVTTFDLAGEAQVARLAGTALLARAAAGRVALGWSPGAVTLDTGAGTTTVALAPVHAWSWGGGAALRRPVAARWSVALAAERHAFSLDTAHRAGASVTLAREAFGNWNGRLELARTFGTL